MTELVEVYRMGSNKREFLNTESGEITICICPFIEQPRGMFGEKEYPEIHRQYCPVHGED